MHDKDKARTQRHRDNHNDGSISRNRSDGNLLPDVDLDLAQRRLADDMRCPQAPDRGRRNTGSEDGRSSGSGVPTGENVQPGREARPRSAWNSRSGRRPHFSFSDLEAADGDINEDSRTGDETRRKSTDGGSSGSLMTSVQLTTPRRTTPRRASQIPVRTARLHPATINHVEQNSCQHSVKAIVRSNTATSVMYLSRDLRDENSTKSCGGGEYQVESSRPRAGLKTSCSELSLTEARRRVLARLAESQSPEPESHTIGFRPPPRKLEPIFAETFICDHNDDDNDDEDDQPVFFTCG